MATFIANKVASKINDNGEVLICFYANGYPAVALDELNNFNGKLVTVSVSEKKPKRSIEQNNLMWALLTKMSLAVCGNCRAESVELMYSQMVEEANLKYVELLAVEEAEPMLKNTYRVVLKVGHRIVQNKQMTIFKCFDGSSKFSTAEMTELIELILDRLADLGITDSEIDIARHDYDKEYIAR